MEITAAKPVRGLKERFTTPRISSGEGTGKGGDPGGNRNFTSLGPWFSSGVSVAPQMGLQNSSCPSTISCWVCPPWCRQRGRGGVSKGWGVG